VAHDDENSPHRRPDGHRYDAPESKQDRDSKGWDYLVLGIVVLVLMVLVATGVVPLFDF
jgi:hypothetical protein